MDDRMESAIAEYQRALRNHLEASDRHNSLQHAAFQASLDLSDLEAAVKTAETNLRNLCASRATA